MVYDGGKVHFSGEDGSRRTINEYAEDDYDPGPDAESKGKFIYQAPLEQKFVGVRKKLINEMLGCKSHVFPNHDKNSKANVMFHV